MTQERPQEEVSQEKERARANAIISKEDRIHGAQGRKGDVTIVEDPTTQENAQIRVRAKVIMSRHRDSGKTTTQDSAQYNGET